MGKPALAVAPVAAGGGAISLDRVKDALSKSVVQDLELQFRRRRDTAAAYGESIEAIADKAGVKSSVLKIWIKARVDQKAIETHEKAEQLQLLFDEVLV